MFFNSGSKSQWVVVVGLLFAGVAFGQQSFHHTLAPIERARVQQSRIGAAPVKTAASSAKLATKASAVSRSSAITAAAPPVRANALNQRFMGWKHRVADSAAYGTKFNRTHAAARAAVQPMNGTVALTASAVQRAGSLSTFKALAGIGPASVPGIYTRPSMLAGFIPTAVASGDLNGDGYADWVVANGGDDTLWIYLGKGDGTSQLPVIVPLVGAGPIAVAVADLTNSGTPDIIVAEADSATVGVLLNHGDGTFDEEMTYQLDDSPGAMVVGRFTPSGVLDVAVGFDGLGSTPIVVLPGDGFGNFGDPKPTFWLADQPPAIDWMAAGDVNGDGAQDLVVVDHGFVGGVAVFTNNMDQNSLDSMGTFTLTNRFAADEPSNGFKYLAVELGDVNEDGNIDAVTTDSFARATVYTGSGDGSFIAADNSSFALGDAAQSIALADLTGSGHLDLVTGGFYNPDFAYGDEAGNLLSVLRGDGTGNFLQGRVFRGGVSMVGLALADLNGDGILDVISANQDSDSATVFLNDGNAGFGDPQGWAIGYNDGIANSPVSGVLFADVNGDAKKDMVVLQRPDFAGGDFQLAVSLSNGDGTFAAPVRSSVFPDSLFLNGDFAMADFRGTGKADFVAIGVDTSFALAQPFLAFAPSNGDGTLGQATVVNSPNANGIFSVGDFNKDGKLDLAVLGHSTTSTQPSLTIFLGNGDGSFTELPPVLFGNTQPRFPEAIYAADLRKSGNLDLIVHLENDNGISEVYELAGKGNGSFAAPVLMFTNFDAFTVADVNGDGIPDLVTCKDPATSAAAYVTPSVDVFLSQGNGLFKDMGAVAPYSEASTFPTWRGSASGGQGDCMVADFNGDGKLDVAVVQHGASGDGRTFVQFLSGNGDGSFTPNYDVFSFEKNNAPQFAFDVNGDGKADLVELDSLTASVHVLPAVVGPALQLSLVSVPVVGSTAHGQITLNAPAAQNTTVSISASDPNVFALPTVTVPAGAQSADFLFGLNPAYDNTKTFQITAQLGDSTASAIGYAAAIAANNQYGLSVIADSVTATVAQGSQSYPGTRVTVSSVDGYATTATLSCQGLPAGMKCQFMPSTMNVKANGSGTTSLVISADNNVALGDYPITLAASDGVASGTQLLTVTVAEATSAVLVSEVHASREDLAPGDKFACIATVKNTGVSPATNVHVNFGFQGFADLVNLRASAGTCTTGVAGQMYCDIPVLPAGASVLMTADMQAGNIGQLLFTMDTTAQNITAGPAVSSANYVAHISDFDVKADKQLELVKAGDAATFSLNLLPSFSTFDRAVVLSCSGLPAMASCKFSQNGVTPAGGTAVTLTITTKAPTVADNIMPGAPVYAWLPFASLLMLGTGATRRKRALIALALLTVMMIGMTGCHGFFVNDHAPTTPTPNNPVGNPTPQPGTPTGSFVVTVTAVAGTVQHTTSVTLTVQ